MGPAKSSSAIPDEIIARLGTTRQALEGGWSHARFDDEGKVSYWVSPGFERDIMTEVEMRALYLGNKVERCVRVVVRHHPSTVLAPP